MRDALNRFRVSRSGRPWQCHSVAVGLAIVVVAVAVAAAVVVVVVAVRTSKRRRRSSRSSRSSRRTYEPQPHSTHFGLRFGYSCGNKHSTFQRDHHMMQGPFLLHSHSSSNDFAATQTPKEPFWTHQTSLHKPYISSIDITLVRSHKTLYHIAL